MKKTPPLSDDDRAAFDEAMRGVARHTPGERIARQGPAPSTRPLQREADERAVLEELLAHDPEDWMDSSDQLLYRAPGVQDAVIRKLRRGSYRIESELDLHGLNTEGARQALARFLVHCREHELRCVRIIHGKGLRSPNSGPVLKTRVDGWLRKRREVLAFVSARPEHGGTGAVYVLLRGRS